MRYKVGLGASQVVLVVKNPPAGEVRDTGSIPGLGRSPGGGNGNSLQCFCLENPMDRGAWWATVHRVAKSQSWLKRLSTHPCKFDFRTCSTVNISWTLSLYCFDKYFPCAWKCLFIFFDLLFRLIPKIPSQMSLLSRILIWITLYPTLV